MTDVTMSWDLDPRQIVEAGYDRVAEQYLAGKDADEPVTLAALERLARTLPPCAAVLDLGCGAGVTVTRWLAQRFAVIGVDLSARQLELAQQHVPHASQSYLWGRQPVHDHHLTAVRPRIAPYRSS